MLRATCPGVAVVMVPLFVKVSTNSLVTPQLEPVALASAAVAVGTAVAAPEDALPMSAGAAEQWAGGNGGEDRLSRRVHGGVGLGGSRSCRKSDEGARRGDHHVAGLGGHGGVANIGEGDRRGAGGDGLTRATERDLYRVRVRQGDDATVDRRAQICATRPQRFCEGREVVEGDRVARIGVILNSETDGVTVRPGGPISLAIQD